MYLAYVEWCIQSWLLLCLTKIHTMIIHNIHRQIFINHGNHLIIYQWDKYEETKISNLLSWFICKKIFFVDKNRLYDEIGAWLKFKFHLKNWIDTSYTKLLSILFVMWSISFQHLLSVKFYNPFFVWHFLPFMVTCLLIQIWLWKIESSV